MKLADRLPVFIMETEGYRINIVQILFHIQ